ncbi:hypothetical protein [Epilithonimonas hominis]|uniref:hypothetical protein n=1 Tax=Epilithonimonas hominis TaxID=420404 RepID=UPI00289B3B71|nr:hypothetical protein [Epilithonimonas hominis]
MATFEGTFEEFYKFLGPRTSDLVTKYARSKRKEQKSCNQFDGEKRCGKYTRLDAAHLCGRERSVLIKEILDEFATKKEGGVYEMGLADFEIKFGDKHNDFFNVIEFMCRKHHKAYDAKNKKENNCTPDINDYEETPDNYLEIPNLEEIDIKKLRKDLVEKINYENLNINNCSISRICFKGKSGFWNVNIPVEKSDSDYYLLCYNQFNHNVVVLKLEANHLKDVEPKKDKKSVSISIPFSESEFIVNKTSRMLEFIDSYSILEI